ncbi:hypothetical protein BDZ45DRAFT_549616, partial [Acephala macrosclerotiorum]
SVFDSDYPHVFLSFDGDEEDENYLNTIEDLGIPLSLDMYPKPIDVLYKSIDITVSRFPYGGEIHCLKATLKLIEQVHPKYQQHQFNRLILFIDSNCVLDRNCLQKFVNDKVVRPAS